MDTLLALALAALPAGVEVDHAALHSPAAQVYVELPDAQRALRSLDRSAFVGFLRSPVLGDLADAYAGELGLQLGPVMSRLVTGRESALEHVRRLSLSLEGIGDAPALEQGFEGFTASLGGLIVMDCDGPEAAADVQRELFALGSWTAGSAEPPQVDLAGVTCDVRVYFDGGGLHAWTCIREARLFIGIGEAPVGTLAERLANPPADAGAPAFPEVPGASTVLFRGRTRAASDAGMGGVFRSTLGFLVPELEPDRAWRVYQREDGRFITQLRGPARGALAAKNALPRAALKLVPSDAMAAWCGALDVSRMRKLLASAVGEGIAGELDAELDAVEAQLATDAVGWSQELSGLSLPKTFLSVGLRDATKFEAAMEALTAKLEQDHGDRLRVRAKAYRKVPTFSFTPKAEAGGAAAGVGPMGMSLQQMLAPSPSFAVYEGRLLASTSRFNLNGMLRDLLKDEVPAGSHAIAERAAALPADVREVMVIDWARAVEGAYGVLTAALTLFGGGEGSALPSADALTKPFGPTLRWTTVDEYGALTHIESTMGPELLLGLIEWRLWPADLPLSKER